MTAERVFAIAKQDDPAALLAALPAGIAPSGLRDRDGTSLVLFCLYSGLQKNLAALTARGDALPLHEAAALGDAVALERALARSPDSLFLLSPNGWTALHLAAFFGREPTVRLLLTRGADANLWGRAFEHNLPLHAACAGRTGKPDVVRALIPATRDIDARQGGGWTPLMLAAANGMADSAALLVGAGADRALANDAGKTAVALAREHGHADLAARLSAPA